MVQFDEEKQKEKISLLRAQEEEELARILSEKYDIGYVDLTVTPIDSDALRLITQDEARAGELVPFNLISKRVDVAVKSPNNERTKQAISEIERRGYKAKINLASQRSLGFAWERYKDLSYASVSKKGELSASSADIIEILQNVKTLDEARDVVTKTLSEGSGQTSRNVEVLLAAATAVHASDIHLEPENDNVRMRFRLDGILTDILTLPNNVYSLLLSRIKILSGMKLNIKNEAQDGRFSVVMDNVEVEVRSSAIPGEHGESVVMRLLNPNEGLSEIDELGIDEDLIKIIKREVSRPNGMVLATGPTGSGKTTALYAFLRHIYTPDIKIITIEDPIEYHIKGIVQTQIDRKEKYTFAGGLRAALRQDPDVILVGEIRDSETAETAINAALTGHLVLSTLHTNNAAGTFPRLVDLGVGSEIIGSAVRLSLAQRLARKLCADCKKEVLLSKEDSKLVGTTLAGIVKQEKISQIQKERSWVPVGCQACGNTGYRGRVGVFEGILVDKTIEDLVRTSPSERDIKTAARSQGILTMLQDGVIKALKGITSFEELRRVINTETE